jgi:penicillin G amidase
MVTVASPVIRRRPFRLALRIGVFAALAIILCVAGGVLWFRAAVYSALPQLDGTILVPGLGAPVTVVRDRQGVPHIKAAALDDLFFAQGYVTAQDRLWQMDMLRRYGGGELAEILGPRYVALDRQQRTLLMPSVAKTAAANLPARERAYFEDYARGVNAFIAGDAYLPVEFRLFRYRPRPWTVSDSLLVAGNMVQTLNLRALPDELAREEISARVGPDMAADLYPNSSWRDHPPVGSPGRDEFVPPEEDQPPSEEEQQAPPTPPSPAPRRKKAVGTRLTAFAGEYARPESQYVKRDTRNDVLFPGSNNWVVSGAHTVSGKPLLANDMHLEHTLPNVWYEAHLSSGDFDVAGVSLPGMPFVIVGHNRRIAWGFTNVEPTVADIFVEYFNARGEYLTPDGWRAPEVRHEVITVHGQSAEDLAVTITRHGPIISGLSPEDIHGSPVRRTERPPDKRKLALKWTAYEPGALQVPFFDMNSARDWPSFRQALQHFTSPAQNVVYADIDGHIGYQAAGMIPVRAAGDGALPVSGADNFHEWTGFISFEQLPSVFDPASGVIATANGRITPDGYPNSISAEWGPPYRTARIYRVLGADRKYSPADMLALQTDVYSDLDRFCAERFVYAVDHSSQPNERVRQAADLMRNWDGRISVDSVAANIVVHSRQTLSRLLLEPRLGDFWQDYSWFMSSVWTENMLLHQPARWLPTTFASWDELLAAAVSEAVNAPGAARTWEGWQWGKEHYVDVEHPIFGMAPLLRRWTGTGRQPQSGNGLTVKQVGPRFGPSERMTIDFSNLDGSTLNIVNGQSGNIFSPHYMDQWSAWYGGTTFPLAYSAEAVEKAKAHTLVLEPQ